MSKARIVEEYEFDGMSGFIHGMGKYVRRIIIPVEGIPGGGIHITLGNKGVRAGPYTIGWYEKALAGGKKVEHKPLVLCEGVEIPDHIANTAIVTVLKMMELDGLYGDVKILVENPQFG